MLLLDLLDVGFTTGFRFDICDLKYKAQSGFGIRRVYL